MLVCLVVVVDYPLSFIVITILITRDLERNPSVGILALGLKKLSGVIVFRGCVSSLLVLLLLL